MAPLDWLVVAAYVVGVVGIGAYFSRRAGNSAEAFLVADRKLPWWVIGLSDVASSAGADAFWVLVVFSGAFVGLGRFYWISAVVSLPIGVLWARYWRRLRLVSPGELYEVRYSGVAAGRFRGFIVVYGALFSSALLLGYILQGFAQIMAPFLGWPDDMVLLVFCGISMAYTAMSGLLGVAYSDVPQFALLMVGRLGLAWVLVDAAGGIGELLDTVVQKRGTEFLQPYPPGVGALWGKWQVEPMTFAALAAAGLFSIAGTRSAVVQRSLAARTERDAALGQVFNAVLTLVVRIVPVIVIGLAGIALLDGDVKAADVWGKLVQGHAGPGLMGVLMVGLVAGYMSTIDTFLNFMTAGLFNDFYRRHLHPEASVAQQVWFCRGATVLVTIVAYLWARVLVGRIDADWLNFANSVMGLFMLPLALLRWTWWRLNIWGEVVAFVGGVPLAYLVWFTWGFKDVPYWQSFAVLFVVGWGTIIAATLLTRPERKDVLVAFYKRVRPPGLWGPIAAEAGVVAEHSAEELRWDVFAAIAGLLACASMVVAVGAVFARSWTMAAVTGLAIAAAGFIYIRATMRADGLRRSMAGRETCR